MSDPSDRGAQSLEFALVTPLVLLLLLVVVTAGAGVLGVLRADQLAATAARLAAVGQDPVALDLVGGQRGTLDLDPPASSRQVGDLLTATVSLPVRLLLPGRPEVSVTGMAVVRTEAQPTGGPP